MQIVVFDKLNEEEKKEALKRPAIKLGAELSATVSKIIKEVRELGDASLIRQAKEFDKVDIGSVKLDSKLIKKASKEVSKELKKAIKIAYENIYKFHEAQIFEPIKVQTLKGVKCELISRAIEKVGLYIPGGSAPLFSTTLMLAIPAKIAGCKKIVLASPAKINPAILYAATLCGVSEIYQMGGAGAIAALAYGTQSVCKVDKIFGPGNAFVTEAKRQVSADFEGAAIDMQAGPSEVLVIADEFARADFVASDLLSQAEHGADSQVILLCLSKDFAKEVSKEVQIQLQSLPRKEIASKAIENSRIIVAKNLKEAVEISNLYAPEHLIIQTKKPRTLLKDIQNAGSIFLGAYSPESMGDYASGTNHVLPTYALTKTHSSLNLSDFTKKMTVQELSLTGFKKLAPVVETLAKAELLDAHKKAVSLRLESLK
ncbi:histidinol dehydrogenase [Campylobacter sp. MIT 99-7217]|uniref:histidinol dehydrogenase n=1 Tax=Campylobacter sp. MIT 99-7217 TaxID=535091 RepID=UPI00115C1452|nr:histidinol dehydrogenase [Campylobacter sp. MIT 99-7217]TQR29052.1 histidinol dehydrogenase [Campylobacter sp. MIT 99-7217]